jgi:hypothetical protein
MRDARCAPIHAALTGLAMLALAGCDISATPPDAQAPGITSPAETEPASPDGVTPSAESRALAQYFAQVENDLVARGLLRTDGGGPDTPYTERDLARNFERIAFYDEYVPGQGFTPARNQRSPLRKWAGPVRVSVEFGAHVPQAQRASDTAEVTRYVARLARLTGHPISMSEDEPNYHVLFMSEDDRTHLLRRIRQIEPRIDQNTYQMIRDLPRSVHCLVAAFSDREGSYVYTRAIAVIRSEHPPLSRLACIHEEIAQGLGLANDSARARPSIFNDDEEFALLTSHDEELLRLLYNPALTPGMTAEEARPIIRRLLVERVGTS